MRPPPTALALTGMVGASSVAGPLLPFFAPPAGAVASLGKVTFILEGTWEGLPSANTPSYFRFPSNTSRRPSPCGTSASQPPSYRSPVLKLHLPVPLLLPSIHEPSYLEEHTWPYSQARLPEQLQLQAHATEG